MRSDCHAVFSSMTVSPSSSTPYSDAVDRRRRHLRGPPAAAAVTAKGSVSVGRIKRPMNAFMVWAQTERRRLSAENPGLHNVEISRRLGQKWLQMKEEERLPFMEEAEKLRLLHLRQYPDYRYQPRKKTNSVVKVEKRETTAGEKEKPTPAFHCTGREWNEGNWKALGPLNDSVRGNIDRWRQEEDGFWTPIPRNSSPNNTNQSMESSCSDYFVSASVLQRQWPPPTATPLGDTLMPWSLPGREAAFCPHSDLPPIHLPASVPPHHPTFPCPSTDLPPDCLHRSLGRDSAVEEEGIPSFAGNATTAVADADCLLSTDPFISWLMNVYEVKDLESQRSSQSN